MADVSDKRSRNLRAGRTGHRPRGLVLAWLLVVSGACAGEADRRSEGRAESGEGDGHGYVVLDGTAYEVIVRGCNLSGADDGDGGNTLDGLVLGPGGKRYVLEASRIALPTGISHSVWISARGRGWSAERVRAGDRWTDPKSGEDVPNQPLVRVTGNDVVVDGAFRPHGGPDATGPGLPGALRVTCPR